MHEFRPSPNHFASMETIVRLKITSTEHDPVFISDVIGVSCDRCWRTGDFRPKTTIREKTNGWVLGSGLEKAASLDEHLRALFLRVTPARYRLLRELAGDRVEVSCVIYASSPPALNFRSEIIAEIGAIGASLDIDLYT